MPAHHIRLEQVEVKGPEIDNIDGEFDKLRWLKILVNRSLLKDISKLPPPKMPMEGGFLEGRIASEIAAQSLEHLHVCH